jgi:hypothetical protein
VGSWARLNFGDADYVYLDEPFDDGLTIKANEIGIGDNPGNGGDKLQVFGNLSINGEFGSTVNFNHAVGRVSYIQSSDDGGLRINSTQVAIKRAPDSLGAAFQVEGNASKTTAGSWLANSDRRIKTDIETLDGAQALKKLRAVRPVAFRYTAAYRAAHPSIDDRPYLNVIAQEYAQVFPDWTSPSGESMPESTGGDPHDRILQVDTWPLTIYAVAAVKELDARNAKLEAENDRLRERLETLERMVEKLSSEF